MLLPSLSLIALSLFPSIFAYTSHDDEKRTLRQLSTSHLDALSTHDPALDTFLDWEMKDGMLNKLLIPRAPDTDNNTLVQNYLIQTFKDLDWTVEKDSFVDSTPYGDKRFTNLIFTFDPDAPRRVVLAAHFDSKFFPTFPDNQFVGATDSAFPVSLLLSLATSLTPLLKARHVRLQTAAENGEWVDTDETGFDEEEAGQTTLQIVMFDGEEAFKEWTDTDSIYGARHLASLWENTYLPPPSPDSFHALSQTPPHRRRQSPSPTRLSSITTLILLDLLGSQNPHIQSYYPSTGWLFDALKSTERRLGVAGHFADLGAGEGVWAGGEKVWGGKDGEEGIVGKSWFRKRVERKGATSWMGGGISDDHLPFLHRGVDILHVISSPFPSVWHTLRDDSNALHLPTLRRWDLIFRVFVAEYLGLQPDPSSASTTPTQTAGSVKVERSTEL